MAGRHIIQTFLLLALACSSLWACTNPTAPTVPPEETWLYSSPTTPTNTQIVEYPTATRPSATASETAQATPRSTSTAGTTKTPTPTNTPTPTPYPEFTAQTKDELVSWLVRARKNGTDFDTVVQELIGLGRIRVSKAVEDDLIYSPLPHGWSFQNIDLNGDGQTEWVLSIITGWSTCPKQTESDLTNWTGGQLWIINEKGLVYELYSTNEYYNWGAPIILFDVDITGDGLPDLVTRSMHCGAHTNIGMYHVISAHHHKIENIVMRYNPVERAAEFYRTYNELTNIGWDPMGISLPTPDQARVADATQDGIPDLILSGGTFGSVGAGMVRYRTEVWSWKDGVVQLDSFKSASSTERTDYLYDANFAFSMQDYTRARILYELVVINDSLTNYSNTVYLDNDYNPARVFAAFRLVLLGLMKNDPDLAKKWQNLLSEKYPNTPITEASHILLDVIEKTHNIHQGCQAVTVFLHQVDGDNPDESYGKVTGTLMDPGYSIKMLWIEDVCPLR